MGRNKLAYGAIVLCLLTVGSICSSAFGNDLEGFDDDADSSLAKDSSAAASAATAASAAAAAREADESARQEAVRTKKTGATPSEPNAVVPTFARYALELASAGLIALYIGVYIVGRRANKDIAEAWAKAFIFKGQVFDKNFSSLGPDSQPVLMKESGNVFKFYATGRRYCMGLLAELTLLARQDALSMLWQLLSPTEDLLRIEVFMTEDAMPPVVLAIATPRHARAMQRDNKDVIKFTKRLTVGKEYSFGEKLWVLAEHSSVFQDLFSDPKIQQLLSFSGPHAASMKYFRSMHFTSENSESSQKRVLRFAFKLPPASDMDALARLMDLVPAFIDIVGTYKLPPDLKKRAMDARVKQEEDDEEQRRKRVEAIQQKKMDKAQEEKVSQH